MIPGAVALPVLVASQQLPDNLGVVNTGGSGRNSVDGLRLPVHAYVNLHAEVVLAALFRGAHLRLAVAESEPVLKEVDSEHFIKVQRGPAVAFLG